MKKFLTICAVIIITAGSVWADTHYVDPAGTNISPYTTPATAAHSIQDAINAASDGDVVDVADATYTITGKILVDKGVTITGNTTTPANVVVQYSTAANSLIFDMRASNATIQGIKVTGGKAGFWFDQSAVTGCTISNCIVDCVGEYGIYMKNGGSGHTIDLCTISNTGQTYAGAPAVLIENCLDVTFSNNTLSSISDKGVYVKDCNAGNVANRVEVTGNTLSGCSYPCVQVYKSPYTYVYNNTISSTGDKGINIIGPNATSQAERVVVEGNSISGCPWGGILLTHDRYTYIYNNTIFSTGDKGISIANGENVTSSAERIIVEGNNISGTKYPGIQVAYAVPYTYIYNNTLSGCNYYGADNTGDWDYASIHVDDNCGNTIVESNDISDGINGIQIWSDNCTVTNNTIYDMGLTYADTKGTADGTYYNSGIIIGSNWLTSNFKPTGTTITGNSIYDNYWGLYVRDYANLSPGDPSVLSVTAEKNWWGDATGADHSSNPHGIGQGGDAVSDNVDFTPWYATSTTTSSTQYVTVTHNPVIAYSDKIQGGIDAALAGDFINVAAGTYAEYLHIIKDGLTIQGVGIDQSIIDVDGLIPYWHYGTGGSFAARGAVLIAGYGNTGGITDLVEDVTFKDFTVKNAGVNYPNITGTHTGSNNSTTLVDGTKSWTNDELVGYYIVNANDYIDNSGGRQFYRAEITGNTATTVTMSYISGGDETDWDNGDTYVITEYREWYDQQLDWREDVRGIRISAGKNIEILNCKVEYCGDYGVCTGKGYYSPKKASKDITIHNCTISDNHSNGIGVGNTTGTITITNNTVSDNEQPLGNLPGRDLYDHVTGISIKGRSKSLLLAGTVSGNTVSDNQYIGINIGRYTDGFTVENNTVTGHNLHEEGAGIFLTTGWGFTKHCRNHTVRNNTVTGNIRGIIAYYSWDNTIENNVVTTDAGTFNKGQAAIKIDHAYNNTVIDNSVSCDGLGIELTSSDTYGNSIGTTGHGNTVNGAMFAGVYIRSGAHDNTFTGNTITNTTSHTFTQYADWGSHTGSDNAAILEDNTKSWTSNAFIGFTVLNTTDGSSGTITANTAITITATLSGGDENDWDTNDDYDITYNETQGDGVFLRGGFCYAGGHAGTGNVFHRNNISGNAGDGMENQVTTMTVNAECNWWGDPTGPYHATTNIYGLGNEVTDYVDYVPWWTGLCVIDVPDQLPFCYMQGNSISVGENTIAGNLSYAWTLTGDDGWSIVSGGNESTLVYNAGTGTATFTLLITTDEDECDYMCSTDLTCIEAEEHCTMTQGFYGNEGGVYCDGSTTTQLLYALLVNPLVVGDGYTLTITGSEDDVNCLIDRLPGGGPEIPITENTVVCDCDVGIACHKKPPRRWKNTLVAQTVTLGLNLRLSPGLGGMDITSRFLTTAASSGCGIYTSLNHPVNADWRYNEIPLAVYTYLETNPDPDINDLYALANDALDVDYVGGLSLEDITNALGAINKGFEGCMFGTFDGGYWPPELQSHEEFVKEGFEINEITHAVYPNPFDESAIIEFTLSQASHVKVEIYTISGVLADVLYDGFVEASVINTVEVRNSCIAPGIFMYVIHT
ncbi:MAG: right-handed parallel beta-helix repeat-containing protein, partial [Bacteroidales bacterium]|nr:right-handed parallel beta-helix repeat-containing protein [Bacteroidales bacterium]